VHPDPAEPGRPEQPTPAAEPAPAPGGERPAPGEDELAEIAVPATVRRAPRYRAFVVAGVVVAVLVSTVLVLVFPARAGAALGSGAVWLLLAIILGGVGALLGALVAVGVDRRSRRGPRPRRRRRSGR
jgi:hypothetical protein